MAGEAVGGVWAGFCCVAARSRWRGSARMAWRGTVGIGSCGFVRTGGSCVARRSRSCGLVRMGVIVSGCFVLFLAALSAAWAAHMAILNLGASCTDILS